MSPLRSSGSDERQLLFVGEKLGSLRGRLSPALLKAAVSLLASSPVVHARETQPPAARGGGRGGAFLEPVLGSPRMAGGFGEGGCIDRS